LGDAPSEQQIAKIRRAIEKSYDLYLLALDHGMKTSSVNLAIKVA
jgi:hypothetical protein